MWGLLSDLSERIICSDVDDSSHVSAAPEPPTNVTALPKEMSEEKS
jgi:hypothetical protein